MSDEGKNTINIATGLSERLRTLRKAAGLTQSKLAELADLSVIAVQKIEAGERFGNKTTHKKLAVALNVSVSLLVYGTEQSSNRLRDLLTWITSKNPSDKQIQKIQKAVELVLDDT